jgi:hypothetical protein
MLRNSDDRTNVVSLGVMPDDWNVPGWCKERINGLERRLAKLESVISTESYNPLPMVYVDAKGIHGTIADKTREQNLENLGRAVQNHIDDCQCNQCDKYYSYMRAEREMRERIKYPYFC